MKFTLSWLKEHLDTDSSLENISETLTRIGLEVEGIEDKAAALAPLSSPMCSRPNSTPMPTVCVSAPWMPATGSPCRSSAVRRMRAPG